MLEFLRGYYALGNRILFPDEIAKIEKTLVISKSILIFLSRYSNNLLFSLLLLLV
jgi:hypothetical protein